MAEVKTDGPSDETDARKAQWLLDAERLLLEGKARAAVDAFDSALALDPAMGTRLWQRGIALFQAGRFQDAADQFAADQRTNGSDAEEALWEFICVRAAGQSDGRDAYETLRMRRAAIASDDRVPLTQVIDYYLSGGGEDERAAVLRAVGLCPGPLRSDPPLDVECAPQVAAQRRFLALFYVHLFHHDAPLGEAVHRLRAAAAHRCTLWLHRYAACMVARACAQAMQTGRTALACSAAEAQHHPPYTFSRIIKGCWQYATDHDRTAPTRPRSLPLDATRDLAREEEVMRAARHHLAFNRAGITTLDCGDIYSGVEELLGEYVREHRERRRTRIHPEDERLQDIQIHTKFVPDLDQLECIDERHVRGVVLRSLNRLGVDSLDLVQFHWWDYAVGDYVEAARHLCTLQAEGLIRHIGVTNFDAEHLKVMVDGGIPIVSNQVQYSLLDRRVETHMVPYCTTHNISLLCYGTLAGGFLSDAWLGKEEPRAESLANRSLEKYLLVIQNGHMGWDGMQRLLRTLRDIADAHNEEHTHTQVAPPWNISVVALAWVLSRTCVSAIIVGSRNIEYLPQLQALGAGEYALTSSDMDAIGAALEDVPSVQGPFYAMERDRSGGGKVMKYRLNLFGTRDVHLEELCRRYTRNIFAHSPDEASRHGWRYYDGRLGPSRAQHIHRLCAELRNMLEESTYITERRGDGDASQSAEEKSLVGMCGGGQSDAEVCRRGGARTPFLAGEYEEQQVDLLLLRTHIRQRLTIIEGQRSWEIDPNWYITAPFDAIYFLAAEVTKEGVRLEASHRDVRTRRSVAGLISRLTLLPRVFDDAKSNLRMEQVPELFLSIALRTLPSCKNYFDMLRGTFRRLSDLHLCDGDLARVSSLCCVAAHACDGFERWLASARVPPEDACGSVAVGEDVYLRLVEHTHMFGPHTTADSLIARGRAAFDETIQLLEETAKQISALEGRKGDEATWQAITRHIQRTRRADAATLLDTYMSEIDRAHTHFAATRLFDPLPPTERVVGQHTPEALRPFSPFGDFLNPPPFSSEKCGTLMLHPIDGSLSEEEQGKLLGAQDLCFISVIAPHECYPGHHLQALMQQNNPRMLRKAVLSPLFYEGWGLYTEEMAYTTGFFTDLHTRLTQLRLRLWRCARVILDVQLHTGRASVEDCVGFLRDEVLFEEENARGEVNIYAFRPTYVLSYMLGYQGFTALKEEYARRMMEECGESVSEREYFHTLLSKGSLPFHLLRRLLFPQDYEE